MRNDSPAVYVRNSPPCLIPQPHFRQLRRFEFQFPNFRPPLCRNESKSPDNFDQIRRNRYAQPKLANALPHSPKSHRRNPTTQACTIPNSHPLFACNSFRRPYSYAMNMRNLLRRLRHSERCPKCPPYIFSPAANEIVPEIATVPVPKESNSFGLFGSYSSSSPSPNSVMENLVS